MLGAAHRWTQPMESRPKSATTGGHFGEHSAEDGHMSECAPASVRNVGEVHPIAHDVLLLPPAP
jgi:hypothetical protein